MRISYLINELEQLKEKHGDLTVTGKVYEKVLDKYWDDNINDVNVVYSKDHNNTKVVSLKF